MKPNSIKTYFFTAISLVFVIITLNYLYFGVYPKILTKKSGSVAIREGFMTETEVASCESACLEFFTKRILDGIAEQAVYANFNLDEALMDESLAMVERKRYFSSQRKLTKTLNDYNSVYENYEKINNFSRREAIKQTEIPDDEIGLTKADYRITNLVAADGYLIADLFLTEGLGNSSILIIKSEPGKYTLAAGPGTFFADDSLTNDIPSSVILLVNDRLSTSLINDPLIKYLPYINPESGYEINYLNDRDSISYTVTLYGDSDVDFLISKNNALNWIKTKNIDPERIDIEFLEKPVIRPENNYLE